MFTSVKKSFAVLCATAIIGSSIQMPVHAASKPQGDGMSFEGSSARSEEIKKNGGEEICGIAFYKLDQKAQNSFENISYEDFSKKYKDEMTEGSAAKGSGKGTVEVRDWYSYSSKYMYDQLSSNEKKLYDQFYAYCMYYLTSSSSNSKSPANYKIQKINFGDHLKEEAISPDFNFKKMGLELESVGKVLVYFQYENPQFYFLEPDCYYLYGKSGTPESIAICFFNKFSDSEKRAKVTNSTFDKIDSYAEKVRKQPTDAEKARKAEELIMSDNKYALSLQIRGKDYREWYDQSMYSAFNLGYTVCAGYAKSTSAVLRKAGMSAMCVTSVNHAWNLVKVDGKWYTLDSTWDDSDDGRFSKDYFLKSDKYTTTHDMKDLYGRPAHVRDTHWKNAPLCKADYGKKWTAKDKNINKRFDDTDNNQSKIKTKLEKTKYDPSQNKKEQTDKSGIASKKPKILKVTKNASSVRIKWNKISGEITGYKIEMSTSADFTKGVKRIIIKKSGVTNHKFGSLKKGKTYYFRIRAYKNTSEGVVYSKWSSIKKVTIK